MKLLIKNNNLIIKNKSKYLKFLCKDQDFIKTVKALYNRFGVEEMEFSLKTISSRHYSILFPKHAYQVIISPAVSFELANRMILLNEKLKKPVLNEEK